MIRRRTRRACASWCATRSTRCKRCSASLSPPSADSPPFPLPSRPFSASSVLLAVVAPLLTPLPSSNHTLIAVSPQQQQQSRGRNVALALWILRSWNSAAVGCATCDEGCCCSPPPPAFLHRLSRSLLSVVVALRAVLRSLAAADCSAHVLHMNLRKIYLNTNPRAIELRCARCSPAEQALERPKAASKKG